eukprot:6207079-Pleurochrysis_carterae.AAC.3
MSCPRAVTERSQHGALPYASWSVQQHMHACCALADHCKACIAIPSVSVQRRTLVTLILEQRWFHSVTELTECLVSKSRRHRRRYRANAIDETCRAASEQERPAPTLSRHTISRLTYLTICRARAAFILLYSFYIVHQIGNHNSQVVSTTTNVDKLRKGQHKISLDFGNDVRYVIWAAAQVICLFPHEQRDVP